MKNTAYFLDALRAKLNLPSDGRVADYLGMHRQHVSHYRTLNGTFSDDMSIKVAQILEIEPAFVIACMHHQRAKTTAERNVWERLASLATEHRAIAASLAGLAVIMSAHFGLLDLNGGLAFIGFTVGAPNIHYANLLNSWTFWPLATICAAAIVWLLVFAYPRAPQKEPTQQQ